MFERYTEQARRVIFFARYEASQYGSPCIETEHLLLGILRADLALCRRLLPNTSAESLRKEIEMRITTGTKVATSVDLPLSNAGKRALAYAAEEADRLQDRRVGSEHVLLGLLREKISLAAELLGLHSVTLDSSREFAIERRKKLRSGEGADETDLIQLHGEMWHNGSVQMRAQELAKYAWRRRGWKPLDILVEKATGRIFFDLSFKQDPQFELRSEGWPQGRCETCGWELTATGSPDHSTGYTNGRDWVCEECYLKFLSGTAPTSPPEAD